MLTKLLWASIMCHQSTHGHFMCDERGEACRIKSLHTQSPLTKVACHNAHVMHVIGPVRCWSFWHFQVSEREREVPIDMVREALWDGIMREGSMRRKGCTQSSLDPCLLAKGLHHSKALGASCSNIIRKTNRVTQIAC
jgi:hypothetical protein